MNPNAAADRARSSVLVVDDDVDSCCSLADVLADRGYDVATAHDGRSALELAAARPFDIALLDFRMPDMNGVQLWRRLKALRTEMVALLVTAHASPETERAALAEGALRVVSKPVDVGKLLSHVGNAVDLPLVMIVDDDRELCAGLRDVFRERRWRVAVAHDERSAEGVLAARDFDVVLVDLKLGEGDGTRIVRLIRREASRSRTLVVTGHRDEYERRIDDCLSAGADGVCYKPFDLPSLLATVERLARRAQAGRTP